MSTDFTFRDFLISEQLMSEEKMVTVDADDPAAAKAQIQNAARLDPKVLARKNAVDANKKRTDVAADKEATGPAARLAKQEAKEAAMLARTRDQRAKAQAAAK